MIQKPYTIVKALFLLTFLLFLSGCADKIQQATLVKGGPGAIVKNNTPSDSESELQENEADMCTDQELSALGQSGLWTDPYPPLSFNPIEGVSFDFPVVMNKQVEMYLYHFQHDFREQFARWLQKSAAYIPMMETAFAEAGLPRDLVYLPMIESGYNPMACSRSMAVGLWQFMEGTGVQYNLEIDKYIDERRDPQKSTQAAAAFLADLYKEFGDWHLAIAAYNGGPGKIRNGLNRHNVDNFWDLASKDYLALETKRYVPKLIAALIIAKQPEKFGFSQLSYQSPARYDVITVNPGTSLEAVALITNSSPEKIKQLNHELQQNKTPPNIADYEVKIPYATAALAMKNLPRLHSTVTTNYKTHKVGRKDSLTSVCALYDVNKTTLLKANNLRGGKLHFGQHLRIPYNTVSYQLLSDNIAKTKAANHDNLVMHQVKKGETVSRIATLYNVPSELIMSWNNLKNVRSIKTGQQLALYLDQRDSLAAQAKSSSTELVAKTAKVDKNQKVALTKGEKRKTHIIEGRSSDAYASYNVQDGDTLYTISQKFNASTSELKKLNNLKSDLIYPGDVLKLKKA